ncbi:MAG TPA: DNA mismatch repair endonuclease MutL, partial [Ktedonobacterales bacterium]|nr:DNA mismatch repair endonuclease MutL [Ktedonobacterales bacterium]
VSGYISRPTCYKATRQFLSFFVNRRWVQSRSLSFAVEEAYHSLLLTGRHPVVVVNVTLDPSLLDVNVHPAKTEVRFLRERQVYAAVQRATRAALLATAAAPDVSPRVFAVPNWEAPTEQPFTGVSPWDDTPDDATHPAHNTTSDAPDATPADPYSSVSTGATGEAAWAPDAPFGGPQVIDAALATAAGEAPPTAGRRQAAQSPLWRDHTLGADGLRRPGEPVADGFRLPGPLANTPVGGKKFPPLRVMGQVAQSYILAEGPDGVYLVDQHAAHERILLDRMVAEWRARAVASQLLLEPLVIELAPDEREAVEDHLAALRAIGFALELRDDATADTLLVRATPGALSRELREQPLRDLLLALVGADAEAASHGETWEEHALANVACKAAIKAGQALNPAEQRALIEQLEAAHASLSCCHGRPTMIHLSLAALEREFDRR